MSKPSRLRSLARASAGALCITALLAASSGAVPAAASIHARGDFAAEYVACDEYAGVGLVPIANVIDRVPDDYIVIEPIPGLAIVVAQSGSCDEINVDGRWAKPGTFAQFGVAVVPPLAPGNGDFYQLLFTTDHPQLAAALRSRGVDAHHSRQLSYEIDDEPSLSIAVPKPNPLAFEINGPITLPDPNGPPNPTSVFNYYSQTQRNGNVLQQNVVEGIRFGEGSGVTLTATGFDMQAIVGGEILMFPFFSMPEVFDRTDLTVIVDSF